MVNDFDVSFVNSSGASGCWTDHRNRLDNWTPVSILSILEMSIVLVLIGSRPFPVAALNSPFKDMTRFVVMFKERLLGENANRRGSNFPDYKTHKRTQSTRGSSTKPIEERKKTRKKCERNQFSRFMYEEFEAGPRSKGRQTTIAAAESTRIVVYANFLPSVISPALFFFFKKKSSSVPCLV